MGADKKRKRSKEEGMDRKLATKTKGNIISDEVNEASHRQNLDRPSKKTKNDKKDKDDMNQSDRKHLKKKTAKKEKNDKKDKKMLKEKKDKKEKRQKKDRSGTSSSASDNDIPSPNSSATSSPCADSNDMDADIMPAITTAAQALTKAIVEVMVQEKKTLDHERDVKSYKKEKTEKQVKVVESKTISTTTVISSVVARTAVSANFGDLDNSNRSNATHVAPAVDANGLTKKERKMLKTKQKQLKRKSEGDGEPAFTIKDGHDLLTLKDLRDLVVFVLTETPSLPWIEVRNKFRIDKVLLLYISGLDPTLFHVNLKSPDAHRPIAWIDRVEKYGGPVSEFQYLKEHFEKANVVTATGDKHRIFSPTNTLLNVPLSNSEKIKRENEKKNQKTNKKMKPENYIMSLDELRESNFPIPRYLDSDSPELAEGWIETPKLKKTTLTPPPKTMIAMDCEMCRTEDGPELTRVTLIDHNGKPIFDELVMPKKPILDYLTQYSGMTASRLEGVTTRLADVQKILKKIIDYNTILVGHSLENDMKVLKLAHPFIIDTSLVFHHTRGPPYRPGLKWLAQKWLQRQIQANIERGHDSAEDALACMDLIKLKLTKPPGFGEYVQDQESLFSRLHRFNSPRTSALIDSDSFAGQNATTTIRTKSDQDVVEALPEAIQKHHFVWARLRDIEINHGKAPEQSLSEGQFADTGRASKISSADKIQASEEEVRSGIRSIDESLKRIINCLPPRTAVIMVSGQGDHREVSRMQQRQKHFMELCKKKSLDEIPEEERFLEADEKKLEEAVE
ncbi:hypothetical protein BGZ54_000659, partial [Gamsiella multidivaricata]